MKRFSRATPPTLDEEDEKVLQAPEALRLFVHLSHSKTHVSDMCVSISFSDTCIKICVFISF